MNSQGTFLSYDLTESIIDSKISEFYFFLSKSKNKNPFPGSFLFILEVTLTCYLNLMSNLLLKSVEKNILLKNSRNWFYVLLRTRCVLQEATKGQRKAS